MAEKIASLYAEISADTTKLEAGLKGARGELTKTAEQMDRTSTSAADKWRLAMTAVGVAVGVVSAAGYALKEVIDTTMNYAREVRDLSVAYGITAEEASKILQISDDLEIKTGTLDVAFRQMRQNGLQPTIENLKDLITEYQNIKDPVDKAAFAAEMFGERAGAEMTRLLDATTGEIDEMIASAEKAGLIMSGEALEGAEEYRKAVDELDDAMAGIKLTIGTELMPMLADLVPVATEAAGAISELFKDASERISLFGLMSQAVEEGALDWYEFYRIGAKVQLGMMDVDDAMVAVNYEMAQHATEVIESAKQQATLNEMMADFTDQDAETQAMLTGTNLGLATMAGNAVVAAGGLTGLSKEAGGLVTQLDLVSDKMFDVNYSLDSLNGKTINTYINVVTRLFGPSDQIPYGGAGYDWANSGNTTTTTPTPNAPIYTDWLNDIINPGTTTAAPGGGGGGGGGGGDPVSAAIEAVEEEVEAFEEAANDMLRAASTFSSVAGYAGRMYIEQTISPLADEAEGIGDRIREINEEMTDLLLNRDTVWGSGRYNELMAERTELMERQAEVSGELEEHQARMLELEKQQQNLGYLQQQFNLLEMISEQGLNAEDILQGMELGINADVEDLIDAMTRAIHEMIENAQEELELIPPEQQSGNIGAPGDPGSVPGGPPRQHGGDVMAGRMYPVGEGGPEMFVPWQNGQIIPNDQIGNLGATHNWTMNIYEAGRTVDPAARFGLLRVLAGM